MTSSYGSIFFPNLSGLILESKLRTAIPHSNPGSFSDVDTDADADGAGEQRWGHFGWEGYLWENRIETESSEISLRHHTVEELSSPTLAHTMPTERRKDATFTSLSQATQGLAH